MRLKQAFYNITTSTGKGCNFTHMFIIIFFVILLCIPTVKADVIIPSLFNFFSLFHLIYLIPVIFIEATIVYFLVRLNIWNYPIKYKKSFFIFLCANGLTTVIGFLYPFLNQPFQYSYVSLVMMYMVSCLFETPVIFLFLQKKINKPIESSLIFSFIVNAFSYIFLILITRTQIS